MFSSSQLSLWLSLAHICLSVDAWPVLDWLRALHHFRPHGEKEVKYEKHRDMSILERNIPPCGFEFTKSEIESWCGSGTWSRYVFNLQAAWSQRALTTYFITVKCVKFEYFMANILEVSVSLLLWLLDILDKLPYASVGQLLDWNPGHTVCNYLLYEISYKALLSPSLSSHLKYKMDQMIYIHLLFQLKSLTIPKKQFLMPHFLSNVLLGVVTIHSLYPWERRKRRN